MFNPVIFLLCALVTVNGVVSDQIHVFLGNPAEKDMSRYQLFPPYTSLEVTLNVSWNRTNDYFQAQLPFRYWLSCLPFHNIQLELTENDIFDVYQTYTTLRKNLTLPITTTDVLCISQLFYNETKFTSDSKEHGIGVIGDWIPLAGNKSDVWMSDGFLVINLKMLLLVLSGIVIGVVIMAVQSWISKDSKHQLPVVGKKWDGVYC